MVRFRCVGDWEFAEVKVAGKFPPVSRTRKINAFKERVSTVASTYSVLPRVRVVLVNPATRQTFRVGIVLSFQQRCDRDAISFHKIELVVSVDGTFEAQQQLILIDAIFTHLYNNHAAFMDKLKRFCYDEPRKIVARQVSQ